MSAKQVVKMSAGHVFRLGVEAATGTRVYWDSHVLPDKPSEALPEIGDPWSEDYQGLRLVDIEETPIGDDNSLGTAYTCNYAWSSGAGTVDVLGGHDDVIGPDPTATSLSMSATTDSHTIEPGTQPVFVSPGDGTGSWTSYSGPLTITRLSPTVSVSLTRRYRGSISDLIDAAAAATGKVNSGTKFGRGKGCVLFTGVSAIPVIETETSASGGRAMVWNVTYNYSIRILPGITEDTWQMIFLAGEYVRLSETESSEGTKRFDPYDYATLPS